MHGHGTWGKLWCESEFHVWFLSQMKFIWRYLIEIKKSAQGVRITLMLFYLIIFFFFILRPSSIKLWKSRVKNVILWALWCCENWFNVKNMVCVKICIDVLASLAHWRYCFQKPARPDQNNKCDSFILASLLLHWSIRIIAYARGNSRMKQEKRHERIFIRNQDEEKRNKHVMYFSNKSCALLYQPW